MNKKELEWEKKDYDNKTYTLQTQLIVYLENAQWFLQRANNILSEILLFEGEK